MPKDSGHIDGFHGWLCRVRTGSCCGTFFPRIQFLRAAQKICANILQKVDVCTFYNPFFNTDISFCLQCTYMFCHYIKPRSWSVHILWMFFLTTVYSKVGIVTKHFTSGHFVYNELGRVSIHTASKEITDSFPCSDLSIFFCFCTVVNK